MKIILVGYPGSHHIVQASKYLTSKYLPGFNIIYLNYRGDKKKWSRFLADYLKGLSDEKIIFALDDYLVNGFNREKYHELLTKFDDDIVAVKLHETSLEEHIGYPVTTQYTIWDRRFLIQLLEKTTDPWDFEINGSRFFRMLNVKSIFSPIPAITYDVHSCLSTRWNGINWNGVKEEDLKIIKPLCDI